MENEVKSKKELKAEQKEAARLEKMRQKEEKAAAKQTSGGKKGKAMLILFLVSLVVAAVAFLSLLTVEQSLLNDYAKTKVVVAKSDVPEGTYITKDNVVDYFMLKDVPSEMVPEGSLTKLESLNGMFILDDITKTEVVMSSDYTAMKDILDITDPVETSFGLGSMTQVVAGTLRRGDRISISSTGSSDSRYNGRVLDNILIKDAYSADGVLLEPGQSGQAAVFVVIISRETEQTLNELLAYGGNIRIAKINNVEY